MGTTGTLIDDRAGTRTNLTVPYCSELGTAMFGGPWLLVQCAEGPEGAPVLAVYDLSSRVWKAVLLEQTGPPGGLCAFQFQQGGGCSVAGVGRFWIEFQVTCYHCANSYVLQPIPAGPLNDAAEVSPAGRTGFDLNSSSGVQTLCSPLTYPRVPYQLADGTTSHEPGWIEPLGQFALVADSYPSPFGLGYTYAYLARCGTSKRIKLPGNPGVAATTRDVAWWQPGHIDGIRLPSLKRFTLTTAARVNPDPGAESPIIALSTANVYVESDGNLWAAPFS